MKSLPKNVGFYPVRYQDVFHTRSARVVNKEYAERLDHLRNTTDKVIYISLEHTKDIFPLVLGRDKSPYDLAFMVHTEVYDNKYFVCSPAKEITLTTILNQVFDGSLKELENPVSGKLSGNIENPDFYRIIKSGNMLIFTLLF